MDVGVQQDHSLATALLCENSDEFRSMYLLEGFSSSAFSSQ